jgi:hypothetical protein
MIAQEQLKSTEGRAPGICTYGAAGLKKTHAIATLIPPVLLLDIGEGGTASVTPWINKRRNSFESRWMQYTDADRENAVALLREDVRATMPIQPRPYIDIIHFDNSTVEAWDHLTRELANFDAGYYNSLAIDSLQEFSVGSQTFSKGKGNELNTMNSVNFSWVAAQERAAMGLRKVRNYRDMGVAIYMTGSEDISKDYVKNPMEKGAGGSEPYSVRGTVNLPGKLAESLAHLPDLLFHAKLVNAQITWIAEPEPLPGGAAWWDAKDRYGRLPRYNQPNFRTIFDSIFGQEVRKQIYADGTKRIAGTAA